MMLLPSDSKYVDIPALCHLIVELFFKGKNVPYTKSLASRLTALFHFWKVKVVREGAVLTRRGEPGCCFGRRAAEVYDLHPQTTGESLGLCRRVVRRGRAPFMRVPRTPPGWPRKV